MLCPRQHRAPHPANNESVRCLIFPWASCVLSADKVPVAPLPTPPPSYVKAKTSVCLPAPASRLMLSYSGSYIHTVIVEGGLPLSRYSAQPPNRPPYVIISSLARFWGSPHGFYTERTVFSLGGRAFRDPCVTVIVGERCSTFDKTWAYAGPMRPVLLLSIGST